MAIQAPLKREMSETERVCRRQGWVCTRCNLPCVPGPYGVFVVGEGLVHDGSCPDHF
jgi:hypothetical protein